jgi:hypothetical protein
MRVFVQSSLISNLAKSPGLMYGADIRSCSIHVYYMDGCNCQRDQPQPQQAGLRYNQETIRSRYQQHQIMVRECDIGSIVWKRLKTDGPGPTVHFHHYPLRKAEWPLTGRGCPGTQSCQAHPDDRLQLEPHTRCVA